MPTGVYQRKPPTLEQVLNRFLSKVCFKENGCWQWMAGQSSHLGGKPPHYGEFYYKGKRGAHVISYELFVGPIPEGKELDHLCKNSLCVNPDHLEPVPHQINVQRGNAGILLRIRNASKTHCPQGHPYDLSNTYVDKNGKRGCRICRNARSNAGRKNRSH